jgi:hypothetical protein
VMELVERKLTRRMDGSAVSSFNPLPQTQKPFEFRRDYTLCLVYTGCNVGPSKDTACSGYLASPGYIADDDLRVCLCVNVLTVFFFLVCLATSITRPPGHPPLTAIQTCSTYMRRVGMVQSDSSTPCLHSEERIAGTKCYLPLTWISAPAGEKYSRLDTSLKKKKNKLVSTSGF